MRTVRAVLGFLGLTGYYQKFIKDYGVIAAPLTRLLKKEAFAWTESAKQAFATLKTALMMALVLQLPDFSKKFMVDCDASGSSIGAILHQGGRPLAYFSCVVASHHAKLAAYKRELIGLVKAIRHWRPYLWARAFIVRTNHYSLKFILDQCVCTIPQHQWVSKLSGFDFSDKFMRGK